MNTIREIEKINEEELDRGIAGTSASWHQPYLRSAWVYVGNLDHELTEGDVICVLSQYGEVEDIHLVREEDTGKSRGFAFLKYEDSRSCVLAVDNFVGTKILGRSMRVDHVEKYRLPKKLLEKEEENDKATALGAGHAYENQELSNQYNIHEGQDLFAPPPPPPPDDDEESRTQKKQRKRERKEEKRQRKEDRRRKRDERKAKTADPTSDGRKEKRGGRDDSTEEHGYSDKKKKSKRRKRSHGEST